MKDILLIYLDYNNIEYKHLGHYICFLDYVYDDTTKCCKYGLKTITVYNVIKKLNNG